MPRPASAATAAPPTPIRVYNTLSKTKEPLETVAPGKIGIYLCGPTVYKPSHIGHMVGPVIFDAIKRYLTYSGFKVTLVVNITDVDDKLIVESRNRNMPMPQLADEMTADYMRNLDAMGVDTIDHFPKATENIDEIIELTRTLIDKGFAYASDGDVYFDVGKDPEYGKLSHRTLESMQGEGGEMAERKRSPADFALWKSAKPGEPSWDSPWGKGRPGWHIECSAMSRKLLGETFDIHGGGLDLIFPASRKRNRPERMLPRQAAGQILAAQRPDAGRRARSARSAAGRREPPTAPMRRPSRPARSANRPGPARSANCSSGIRPRRSASSCSRRTIAARFNTAKNCSRRRPRAWMRSIGSSNDTNASPARAFTRSRSRPRGSPESSMPARRDSQSKSPSFARDSSKRWTTTSTPAWRSRNLFELVRLLNKFADDEKLEAGHASGRRTAGNARARGENPPRTGRDARPVPQAGRSQDGRRRRARRPARRAVDRACAAPLARTKTSPPPIDPQAPRRTRRHARRSPRRNGVG